MSALSVVFLAAFLIGVAAILIPIAIFNRQVFGSRYVLLLALISGALWWFVFYFARPELAWGFRLILWIIFGLLATSAITALCFAEPSKDDNVKGVSLSWVAVPASVAFLVAFLVPFWSSTSLIESNAIAYRNLLEVEEVADLKDMPLADPDQPREVDPDSAKSSAAEMFGETDYKGLGSRYAIGVPRSTLIGKKAVWVMPLEHKRFWPCLSGDSVPGYAIVSQSNRMDRKIVVDRRMYLGKGSCMGHDVRRFLYMNGLTNVAMEDPIFILDPEGKPYILVPLTKPQVSFNGRMPIKWALVDPEAKTFETLSLGELPHWIDRTVPLALLHDRLQEWGQFVRPSWYNAHFGHRDTIAVTDGMAVIPLSDGRMGLYTGLQFHKMKDERPESTAGFAILDQHTLKVKVHYRAGITETFARSVLQGRVQAEGYSCPQVTLQLHKGRPVFVGVLKDANGTIMQRGIADQYNREVSGVGSTLLLAQRNYLTNLRIADRKAAMSGGVVKLTTLEGRVVHLAPPYDGDRIMVIEGHPQYVRVAVELSPETLLVQQGHTVRVEVVDTDGQEISPTRFDDLDIENPPASNATASEVK